MLRKPRAIRAEADSREAHTSRRSLAVCHAALESSLLHRPVTIEEIEAERTCAYEADICAHWGIERGPEQALVG